MTTRGYQTQQKNDCYTKWNEGKRVLMPVLATGGGKTRIFSEIVSEWQSGYTVCGAHRQELVGQMSLALAARGLRHDIIAPDAIRKRIISRHVEEYGRSFYDKRSSQIVAGIDTLNIVGEKGDARFKDVTLYVSDEGHHLLRENKWGKAFRLFPRALTIVPTATPMRADGKGLGKDTDGYVDELVLGPTMRELISMGYLADYRIVCPPTDVDYSRVKVGDSGELNNKELRAAVHASNRIVGDVVSTYKEFAFGKLGVTFAVDIEEATKIATAYRKAGVPAEVVHGKTDDGLRDDILRRLRNREILQVVNVDLFGEGFDLPAIEVVSMVRKTESFPLYAQQFGRALRLLLPKELLDSWEYLSPAERVAFLSCCEKPRGIIIDHVGNIERHNLPDKPRIFTLDRRERGARGGGLDPDVIPLRRCENVNCWQTYEKHLDECPFCHRPATVPGGPGGRSSPQHVLGNLFELDEATLKQMRGEEIDCNVSAPLFPSGMTQAARVRIYNNFLNAQREQRSLRDSIALWAGYQKHLGLSDSETYRLFYLRFGIDILSAKALRPTEAQALAVRIQTKLAIDGVVSNG
jgi:DNA repair protein RadD